MAMRKPGAYAPLYANYADDERIMEVGEDAELMYVRMLAYAARTPRTEGWISDRVVMSRLGILPRPATGTATGNDAGNDAGTEPGTDAGSRAGRLCDVGLILREGDGYRIASWLKWNRSVEEMERESARDSGRKKRATSANDGTDAGNDAGLPHPIPLADTDTDTDTDQSSASPRRKPQRPLPAGWEPNDKHKEKARAKGVNVDHEAEKFRTWHTSKDSRFASWDQAFHTWLGNARPAAGAKVGGKPKDQLAW